MAEYTQPEWSGKTGGYAIGQKSLIWLLKITDVRIAYAMMALVIPFYMLFAHKSYVAIYHYFRKRHYYPMLKAFAWTYKNYYRFGQVILDRFTVYAGQKRHFKVEIEGDELFRELLHGKKGFIIASSHVGNFELNGYLMRQNEKPINGLIFGGETKVVQKYRNSILNSNNVHLIPVKEDMSHVFLINKALTNGEIISMPSDRTFGSNKCIECNFLGGKACFPIGAFVLAEQFDIPIVTMFVMKESTFSYHIYTSLIKIEDKGLSKKTKIEQMMQLFVKNLEDIIRKYPEQWFNYYEYWKS